MGKVRLRDAGRANGPETPAQEGVGLRPLRVSGVVVSKAEIVNALRVYVPSLADLRVTDDGEHFWLMLGEPCAGASPPHGD